MLNFNINNIGFCQYRQHSHNFINDTLYYNEELKSLTRYRFDKVREWAQLKQSVSRLVNILFPELEKLVPLLHTGSLYVLLSEFPGASYLASAHLTRLTNLLLESSKGHYTKNTAVLFRQGAKNSIGSHMPAKSLELKHTIKLIQDLTIEIDGIEAEIKRIMDEINSPIITIPGISCRVVVPSLVCRHAAKEWCANSLKFAFYLCM